MDRNDVLAVSAALQLIVALRKESVDRNLDIRNPTSTLPRSLSARRAWIEILYQLYDTYAKVVALRKESVDRNTQRRDFKALGLPSLSARRAWIEILNAATLRLWACPSLSARRAWIEILFRLPRKNRPSSLSARRAWIEIRNSCTQAVPLKVALRKESVDRNISVIRTPIGCV